MHGTEVYIWADQRSRLRVVQAAKSYEWQYPCFSLVYLAFSMHFRTQARAKFIQMDLCRQFPKQRKNRVLLGERFHLLRVISLVYCFSLCFPSLNITDNVTR